MNRSSLPWLVACAACAFGGWQAASGVVPTAWAQELPAPAGLLCRTFPASLEKDGPAIDTTDETSELGRWVAFERVHGWRVRSVDFEVAQKATGYPLGFVQVCLGR